MDSIVLWEANLSTPSVRNTNYALYRVVRSGKKGKTKTEGKLVGGGDVTSCWLWREELFNSDSIQERSTGRILLNPGIVENHFDYIGSSIEPPSISVTTIAAVQRLQWEVTGLRRHWDSQHLVLCAGPRCPESQGVERASLDRQRLWDGGLIAEANGVDPMGHGEEHAAGLRTAGDVLDEASDLPAGQRVRASDDCLVEVAWIRGHLKVAIPEEPWRSRRRLYFVFDNSRRRLVTMSLVSGSSEKVKKDLWFFFLYI